MNNSFVNFKVSKVSATLFLVIRRYPEEKFLFVTHLVIKSEQCPKFVCESSFFYLGKQSAASRNHAKPDWCLRRGCVGGEAATHAD